MCLAQGHNTVMPVRLEHEAPQSSVKHSTTEPLGSFNMQCSGFIMLYLGFIGTGHVIRNVIER